MYIVVSKVKKRAKELGFRTEDGFIHEMEVVVATLVERASEWAKPSKTITREDLVNYLVHHKIKM